MLNLDKNNGHIEIGNILIFPEFSLADLDDLKKHQEVINTGKNSGYENYSIRDIGNGEFALSLIFSLGKLWIIGFSLGRRYQFPPWQITETEVDQLKKISVVRLKSGFKK